MDVGIVAQRGNMRAAEIAGAIASRLQNEHVSVQLDEATAEALETEGVPVSTFDETDLVVSIGGDGTFLFAARGAGGTPILGVNLGEVGFLNAVAPDDAVEAVTKEVHGVDSGSIEIREAPRLAATVGGWQSDAATNEIVVQGVRRGPGAGIDFETRIDGSLYSSGHADGILVATPTGSTAYNLSEGGPLVHPGVDSVILTEMCATDGMPSLLVDQDSTVTVTVSGVDSALVVSDGRNPHEIEPPVDVQITRSDPPLRIAGPTGDFFEALGKLA